MSQTIGELVPGLEKQFSKREEVQILHAMLMSAMTSVPVNEIAKTSRIMGVWPEIRHAVGLANARLNGRISNMQGGWNRVLYPALYRHPESKHRYIVSNGRVVGKPSITTNMIERQGYKFYRLVK